MKLWISDEQAATHRLVRINAEDHSGYDYLGDLNDDEIRSYFLGVQPDMNIEKNLETIKYFGYLHLFVATKKDKRV